MCIGKKKKEEILKFKDINSPIIKGDCRSARSRFPAEGVIIHSTSVFMCLWLLLVTLFFYMYTSSFVLKGSLHYICVTHTHTLSLCTHFNAGSSVTSLGLEPWIPYVASVKSIFFFFYLWGEQRGNQTLYLPPGWHVIFTLTCSHSLIIWLCFLRVSDISLAFVYIYQRWCHTEGHAR